MLISLFIIFAAAFLLQSLQHSEMLQFLGMDITDVRGELGGSDDGHYLEGAIQLSSGDVQSMWIFRLWPAGMMLLIALPLRLGLDAIKFLNVVLIVGLSGACAMAVCHALKSRRYARPLAYAVVVVASPLTVPIVFASGGFMSEGWTVILLILATTTVVIAAKRSDQTHRRYFPLTFLILSVLVNFRIALLPSLLLFVALTFTTMFCRFCATLSNKFSWKEKIPILRAGLVYVGVIGCAIAIGLSPSFVVRAAIDEPISWTSNYVSAGDYAYAQRWLTDAQLEESGASFLRQGGANWACKADPVRCEELNTIASLTLQGEAVDYELLRRAAFASIKEHPFEVLRIKAPYFVQSFSSSPGAGVESRSIAATIFWVITWVLLVPICRSLKNYHSPYMVVVFYLCYVLGVLALLVLAHIETRYLLPIAVVHWTLFALAPASKRNYGARLSRDPVGRLEA